MLMLQYFLGSSLDYASVSPLIIMFDENFVIMHMCTSLPTSLTHMEALIQSF